MTSVNPGVDFLSTTNAPHSSTNSLVRNDVTKPSNEEWANVFGPNAYNIAPDNQRNRKMGRVHLPDVLKGPNQWITDRVDGLITDATNSPFTTIILPYMYMEYPDRKIEWNVWTFDQGLASRVPYEAAARTLTQRKQSFSGYTVRQGLAITMEHNFMMSSEGMQNFHNQVQQVVGSIQNTNDLDVHMALINAPSYLTQVRDRYYLDDYLSKSIRDYIDMFGFVQKNMNALDIVIEDTKSMVKNWGGEEPDFMLCSGKLTFQLTMTQEKTAYFTQGADGKKLLKDGPDMNIYRGLKIIKSKAFSLDEGSAPRDILRRRVRVAEFYVGKLYGLTHIELYDESADSIHQIDKNTLVSKMLYVGTNDGNESADDMKTRIQDPETGNMENAGSVLLIRPNIEHYMLGVIIGRGGIEHLGATLWGQTEMSVFDDGQHGVWGMTYKYHERAIVFNERNLHKVWDIAYDGYCGGKDVEMLDFNNADSISEYNASANDSSAEYNGASIIAVHIDGNLTNLPSPLCLTDYNSHNEERMLATADLFVNDIKTFSNKTMKKIGTDDLIKKVERAISRIYQDLEMCNSHQMVKDATLASTSNESTNTKLMYQGTATWVYTKFENTPDYYNRSVTGCGHHGHDFVGVAAVRNGKQLMASSAPVVMMQTPQSQSSRV